MSPVPVSTSCSSTMRTSSASAGSAPDRRTTPALVPSALSAARIWPNPSDQPDPRYAAWLTHADPAVVATIICLIHQANYLLDQQIRALEAQFVEGGGYSEQLAAARLAHRRKADQPDRSDQSDRPAAPTCRDCGKPMTLRTARQGPRAGSQFWGCSAYPNCKSTQPI